MMSAASPEVRTLEIFAAVCELGSMTLAARRFEMTQPAVSHAIRQLETALGCVLIERRRRPLKPTTAGYWLARTAQQIIHDIHQITAGIRQFDQGGPLRLRLGLVESLSDPFVPALVKRQKPPVRYMSIAAGLARHLRAGLIEHDLDLIITNDPMDDVDGILQLPLLTEPYVLVVPRSFAPSPQNLQLDDLKRSLPLIRWSAQSHIGSDIERQLRRMRVHIERQFEFDSAGSILGMVSSGLGWGVMTPLSIFEVKRLSGRVWMLPFPGPSFTRRLNLVTRLGEIDGLAEQVAETCRHILRELYLPEMLEVAAWLADKVRVGD
jgi:DNA-binding transcriptional LysR family regulator